MFQPHQHGSTYYAGCCRICCTPAGALRTEREVGAGTEWDKSRDGCAAAMSPLSAVIDVHYSHFTPTLYIFNSNFVPYGELIKAPFLLFTGGIDIHVHPRSLPMVWRWYIGESGAQTQHTWRLTMLKLHIYAARSRRQVFTE